MFRPINRAIFCHFCRRFASYNSGVNKTFLLVGAVFAFLGVAFGAFGAHGLRGRLSPDRLGVFATGVRYQMYHALAILLVGLMMSPMGGWAIHTAGWAFVIGIVVFSGRLSLLRPPGRMMFGGTT